MKNTYFKNLILLLTLVFIGTSINAQNITNYFPSDGLNEGGIYTIEQDHNGHMWYGSWTNPEGTPGLSKFDGSTWEQYTTADGLVGNHIRVVFEDKDNNLWIGTTTGVSMYDGSSITNYTTAEGLVDDYVITIIQDTDGNIWVGTNGGVSKFDGTNWTNYTETDNFSLIWINAIIQDSNGEFWFGSGGRGVIKFDGVSTWTNYNKDNSGLEADDIWVILQDKNDDIWFANYFGPSLTKFNGSTWANFTEADGLPNVKIRALAEDSFGDLWIGSNAGATKFDGYELTTYTTNEGLLNGGVRSFFQDDNDDLWVGTWSSGVSKVEISKIAIPDENFEQALIDLQIDTNGLTGDILRVDAENALEINANFPVAVYDSEGIPIFLNQFADDRNTAKDPEDKITDLTGIEAFINLENLEIGYNSLTTINLSNNRLLNNLFLNDNQFTSIDISENTSLKRFGVMRNPNIGFVDISKNDLLEDLFVHFTGISTLDTSKNLNLKLLYAYSTNLKGLDLSSNSALIVLRCQNNPSLSYLNINNDHNLDFENFRGFDTPALSCITADGTTDSEVSQELLERTEGRLSADCGTVYIPDPNFEQALIDLDVDQSGNLDGIILRSEAVAQTTLDVNSSTISDITGIEAFTSLTELAIWNNQISSIDLSNNTSLEGLYFNDNQISILDLTNQPNLTFINIDRNDTEELILGNHPNLEEITSSQNKLQSIDIANCPSLKNLNLPGNQLESIDLSNNLLLEELNCQYNNIPSLNLANNAALTVLECEGNGLTELDVTQNTQLRVLGFGPNNLTEIDVSQNLLLEVIWTNGNNLSTINLDANTKLAVYGLSNNPYKYVSLKNGNNTNVFYFEAGDTPSLDCINSDALVSVSMLNSGKTFSEDCSTSIAGKWIIAPEPGALKVGPEPGSDLWWALNKDGDDIAVRGCYLDDVYEFNEDGSFNNILGFETWLEPWQAIPDQCGTPVAPHDGSVNASYVYDQLAGTITLNGQGAYLGLPKVVNGGELPNVPVPGTITYDVSFSENGNAMTIMIESNLGVFWTFKFLKESVFIPDVNFEQALIDLNIDSDNEINKRILRSDAEAKTGQLNVSSKNISDLTGIEAFTNLTRLKAWYNLLTDVDITQNINLTRLELVGNQLTNIDATKNVELTILWLESNALNAVDVSQNTKLLNLAVGINPLMAIDVTKNVALTNLTTEVTQISEIDLSKNINLEQMWIADNPNLTQIDLFNNPLLFNLGIYNTSITTLDVSNNSLTRLWAYDNPNLTHLDLRNGKNVDLTDFLVGNTPNLTCINADPVLSQAMMDAGNDLGKTFSEDCGDFVYIPDTNFEQSLIDIGIDSDGVINASILRENTIGITELNLVAPAISPYDFYDNPLLTEVTEKISDLTGIEAFEDLVKLQILFNDIELLNMSGNPNLEELKVSENQLTSIQIDSNAKLNTLWAWSNQLTTINTLGNPLLQHLYVGNNQINNVNLSGNLNLIQLEVHKNQLSELLINDISTLQVLTCHENNINQLDISTNQQLNNLVAGANLGLKLITVPITGSPSLKRLVMSNTGLSNFNPSLYLNLEELYLNANNINKMNTISSLASLKRLDIQNNVLTALDLSSNGMLEQLNVSNNQLTSLNVQHGNGIEPILTELNASSNPLTCITADSDDEMIAPYNLWSYDVGVLLSLDCGGEPDIVLIPDNNFEQALIDLGFDGNIGDPINGSILVTDAEAITELNVSGKGIEDLTGIEGFVNLLTLNVSHNEITSLVFTSDTYNGPTSLISLDASWNHLSELFVVSARSLEFLIVNKNELHTINFSDLTDIIALDISFNQFASLDFSAHNLIASFAVASNPLLTELNLINGNNTAITFMEARNNSSLECIGVDNPAFSAAQALWFEDDPEVYNDTGDCQAPTVLTQNFDAILDRNGLVSITPNDIDNGSFDNVTSTRNLTYSLDITDFNCSSLGDQTVNLTVTDDADNSASATAIVTVIDNSPPSANAIRGTYMHDLADGNSFDPILLDDGSTDNCGIASFSLSQSYFTLSGTYYLDLIVEDSSGNVSTDQVEVEITDSENSEELSIGNITVIVYPNPFQDQISLSFSKNMDFTTITTSLTDFNGNPTGAVFVVQDTRNLIATGLSGLLPGSYILTVTKGRKSDTAIMIKN